MQKIQKFLLTVFILLSITALLETNVCAKGRKQGTYTVRQDGKGDFKSIQEGVDAVPSGSTLIIYAGIYDECVRIIGKTVNLQGKDRDTCILQHISDDYLTIPLEIGAGSVENLTIYGYTDKTLGDNWVIRPHIVDEEYLNSLENENHRIVSQFQGYTIHIEQNYLQGKQLHFKNCLIVSDNSHCVGCGLRENCMLLFEDCELRSYGPGGNVFLHDNLVADRPEECTVMFDGCSFYNYYSGWFFFIQSLNSENRVNLLFKDNDVHTVGYSNSEYYTESLYQGITLDDMIALDSDNRLVENGFSKENLIWCYNWEQTCTYVESLILSEPSLNYSPNIPEGIVRLWNGISFPLGTNAFPIYVMNQNESAKNDGWCGASAFFLSKGSGGNTFAQMNYQNAD